MTGGARPLRLVVFSPSIIADIDNPAATSTRALLGALTAAGHEVTHLERRGNPLLNQQLRARGSRCLRALNERYPDVRIRQYDVPRGQQRTVWFGTEVSTADAVVALPGTPDDILGLIAPFETPHLVRVVPPGAIGDVDFAADGPLVCVERRHPSPERNGLAAVAYDAVSAAMAEGLPDGADRIVVGASDLPGWRYLPEVEVAELYRSTEEAIVLDGEPSPAALARHLLPLAAGCRVVARRSVPPWGTVAANDVSEAPMAYDAAMIATSLVDLVRVTLATKRAAALAARPSR